MKEKWTKKLSKYLTIGIDVAAIIATVLLMRLKGPENMEHIMILNIGMDVAAMLMGLILLICSYIDSKRGAGDDRHFRYMVQATFIGVFTDAGAWLMNGVPSLRVLNLLDNTAFFMVTPLSLYFFWRYFIKNIHIQNAAMRVIHKGVFLITLLEVCLCIYNIFGGIFFTIDENGRYGRGTHYVYFMAYVVAMGLVVVVLLFIYRKKISRRQIIVYLIYVLTPLPVILISVFAYGLSANFVMGMMDFLVMYVVLNIEQGREKLAFEKELSTAASIQEGVLPSQFPLFPERNEFDLHASMDPAKEVGGDFYDAFLIDADHLALVVGDVAGKGIPGALFMLMARTLINTRARSGGSPAEIIKDVNVQLFEDNKAKMFVTIWMVIVELSTGHVTEVNAGHECPAVKRGDGDFELVRTKHDLVVGGRKKTVYHNIEYDLSPGDTVFMYTDGVPEATNADGVMFGTDRMLSALNAGKNETSEKLLEDVRKEVDAFVGNADQFDDLTMMAFSYKGC